MHLDIFLSLRHKINGDVNEKLSRSFSLTLEINCFCNNDSYHATFCYLDAY